MQLLSLDHIHKSYGIKAVLTDVSLIINHGERVGLVGENGAGKTTLARIITGDLLADAGNVRLHQGARLGYLPQEAPLDEPITIQQYLERALGDLDRLREELGQLEIAMSAPNADMELLLDRYGNLQEQFVRHGGYEADSRFEVVTRGLDLAEIDRSRQLVTLSGGEKTRLMLAGLLLAQPEVLILDEPTNHLDWAATDWLEAFLRSYAGAVLLISHDRHFLNRTVTAIAELAPARDGIVRFAGNYDAYRTERERLDAEQWERYTAQREEVRELQRQIKQTTHNAPAPRPRSDNDKFAKGFFAGRHAVYQRRQIKNAEQRLKVLEDEAIERPLNKWQIAPSFAPITHQAKAVIQLRGVSKTYGNQVVLDGIEAVVRGGDHLVICGANGSGKTTLIRLVLGLETPDTGEIRVVPGVKIGYLDQELETLHESLTVLEAFMREFPGRESERRADLHRNGVFSEDEVVRPIGTLSVGQRRKFQIAKLVAAEPDILILDEPTNHLDLESVDRFEAALRAFEGTIIAVSHDRAFIEHVGRTVWQLKGGQFRALT